MSRFLVWDFDGTLATREGGWAGAICELLEGHGLVEAISRDVVRPYLRAGFPWHNPERVRPACTPEDWWAMLLPVFENALKATADLPQPEARALAGGVRAAYLAPESWHLHDDTLNVLSALRQSGWRHLVFSNHVPELPFLIRVLGLDALVDAVYSSASTGKEKPNRAAFEYVFADYPAARHGWMIGDSWTADVQGALGAGMRAILVRRQHPEAEFQCDSLAGVIDIVAKEEKQSTGV